MKTFINHMIYRFQRSFTKNSRKRQSSTRSIEVWENSFLRFHTERLWWCLTLYWFAILLILTPGNWIGNIKIPKGEDRRAVVIYFDMKREASAGHCFGPILCLFGTWWLNNVPQIFWKKAFFSQKYDLSRYILTIPSNKVPYSQFSGRYSSFLDHFLPLGILLLKVWWQKKVLAFKTCLHLHCHDLLIGFFFNYLITIKDEGKDTY